MSCYNFEVANSTPATMSEHFIFDAVDLLNSATNGASWGGGDIGQGMKCEGYCVTHGQVCDLMTYTGDQEIDILEVTAPCKPYSAARTGRQQGVTTHPDCILLDCFVATLQTLQPRAAVFEQVMGFTKQESTTCKDSPLLMFLDHIKRTVPGYSTAVVECTGELFLTFVRHRIYIIFISDRAGGQTAAQDAKRLVQDTAAA